ncbi:Hypothetical protein CINCED_3A006376 [Cinara cedri]|uniref:Uncharacterized protein n=1 Tax=Cinara cedri TaxID=506608 RepID=A0A5E4NAN9_9HEMI|nr:Hypothetical protein CINCED_3A006376 [Cinara cedri]
MMVKLQTALPRLLAATAGFCGLYGSFTSAVVAKPTNGSSQVALQKDAVYDRHTPDALSSRDRLETSQSRVNQVQGSYTSAGSGNQVSDYDGYPAVQNTYGPPRDYYYEERPEYFRPHQVSGHYYPQAGGAPPGEIYYHRQQQYEQHSQNYGGGGGGGGDEVHKPGELNIKPLLWPLAGVALLGVLSALVKTPTLLHLGTLGPFRRRRRDAADGRGVTAEAIESLLDKFNNRVRINHSPSCLVCDVVSSIYDQKSACFERSVCEVMSGNGSSSDNRDKQMLTAMVAKVVGNGRIPEEFKDRLERAGTTGTAGGDCGRSYPCGETTEAQKNK